MSDSEKRMRRVEFGVFGLYLLYGMEKVGLMSALQVFAGF